MSLTDPALPACLSGEDPGAVDEDHLALAAACAPGVALCTIVGIDGSFSRRIGAQLAIRPDGSFAGSLADGCLEAQLRTDAQGATTPVVRRYGRDSGVVDFRLPCGGGLDILIDPVPDRAACAAAMTALTARRAATISLPPNPYLGARRYLPCLAIRAFGEGPELGALERIAAAAGVVCQGVEKSGLSLGRRSGLPDADRWTAIVMLFHDHEWEIALLDEALASDAFYIGAQGGFTARAARLEALRERGADPVALARVRSPIGRPSGSRSPQTLALAILAEVAGEYEQLRTYP
ncbi:hypothetical protein GO308_04115 [Sphingomonas sp. SFZ2018-12]|uniref:XdhC family protein n=1 Tax=Sphingomonas sp. SFZ2018-12 TaxID=2683197 RepID=UPI001F116521|nr:XdhC family protein [Sphingomonas sp. SFZ2018-12]MCH4892297.1 hypothetical protein [Sphingomonas sp. SFZ2018-12]